jgi:hypothetical protein
MMRTNSTTMYAWIRSTAMRAITGASLEDQDRAPRR